MMTEHLCCVNRLSEYESTGVILVASAKDVLAHLYLSKLYKLYLVYADVVR